jgi:putative endonuclease
LSRQRSETGKQGEQLAADFLVAAGYRIVERNYREKCGEIDIIARDGPTWVFIEVKARRSRRYGAPVEAVTSHKQHQISATALLYLSRHGLLEAPARFDVVGIDLADIVRPQIVHIKDAFTTG